MKKIVATYHKDCTDGTAAAAVILKKFPEALVFPLHHSYTREDLQPIISLIDNETDFYTIDCALGVNEMLNKGVKVTTIDHHASVKESCEKLSKENSNYSFVFDNDRSGASLSWNYFFPDQELPELIKYVEDVDLWKWKYGDDTKNVINYFSMFSNKPEEFLKYMSSDLSDIKTLGKAITMYKDEKEKQYSEILPIKMKIGKFEVPAINLVNSKSEMGNYFSQKFGETVMLYNIDGDSVKISFRSFQDYNPSALELAETVGGGGHSRAAGAKIKLSTFLSMIVIK